MQEIHRCNINRHDIPTPGMLLWFSCAWVSAVQYTFSQKCGKPRWGLAKHQIESQILFCIAFGYKTVHLFTLWHPNYHCYCLIYWELDMRSCKVLLNSYAESQTSHTFKEHENLKHALGYWKVIIIYLYSALERSGTSCIIMHDFMCESSLKQMVHIIVGYHKDWKTRGQSISWGKELTHWMEKKCLCICVKLFLENDWSINLWSFLLSEVRLELGMK